LVRHGAAVDAVVEDRTPFLEAIGWSRFEGARVLLELGANVNFQDSKKMTALHYMLKKGSDKRHIKMLVDHGARGDLKNKDGMTAAQIMMKKKDPDYRAMAPRLSTGS
jgi:ankyrin repeat protein